MEKWSMRLYASQICDSIMQVPLPQAKGRKGRKGRREKEEVAKYPKARNAAYRLRGK